MLGFNKSTSGRASDRLRLALDQWKIQPPIDAPPALRIRPSQTEASASTFSFEWGSRSVKALIVIGLVISFLVGFLWWSGRPQLIDSDPIPSTGMELRQDDSTGTETGLSAGAGLLVHVAGSVKNPGLYELPTGSRVADAIEAAGGVTKKSDADSVNLARELVDGEQISVGASTQSTSNGISINNSSATQLDELPGIGPVLAVRIVEHRTANGPFRSIDELSDVSGIGDSVLEQIRTLVTL
jgi:competence protein ComEA